MLILSARPPYIGSGGPTPVNAVTLAPPILSVVAGATATVTATPRDLLGNALTGRSVVWSSSDTTVATVSQSGVVSGVGAGSATIMAVCEGKTATAGLTVTAATVITPTPPSSGGYAAAMYTPLYELPHRYDAAGTDLGQLRYNATTGSATDDRVFDATYATARAQITAPVVALTDTGTVAGNTTALLNAITAAGDAGRVITLQGGVEWGQQIFLPARGPNAAPIIICDPRVEAGTFPRAYGSRLQAADIAGLPTFSTTAYDSVLFFGQGSNNYRFVGLDVRIAPTFDTGLANNPANECFRGLILCTGNTSASDLSARGYQSPGNDPAAYPHRIVFDRCAIHGRYGKAWRFGFRSWDGVRMAVVGCRIFDIGHVARDSTALQVEAGPGPYLIENNYLSSTYGEITMIGGISYVDPTFAPVIPRDLQYVGNRYQQAWLDINPNQTKNQFECKLGQRVLVEGNLFDDYVSDGSFGGQWQAWVIKSHSQDDVGTTITLASLTQDVTFRRNIVRNASGWLGCANATQANNEPNTSRVEIAHNLVTPLTAGVSAPPKYLMQIFGSCSNLGANPQTDATRRVRNISIRQNTAYGSYSNKDYQSMALISEGDYTTMPPLDGNKVIDNVFAQPNPANGFNELYIRTEGGQPSNYSVDLWAYLASHGKLINGAAWTNNVVSRTGSPVAGDTGVADLAALKLDPATFAPQTGSPALTGATHGGLRGCDVSLLPALSTLTT